jgi:hypothetical protein
MIRRLLFVAAGLVALFLIVTKWPRPKPAAEVTTLHAESFAASLFSQPGVQWKTDDIGYGHIHFQQHSYAARTRSAIALATDSARIKALTFLEMQDTFPIEVFFVDTREEMQRLVGRPIGGMVQSGERGALLVYNAGYTPFLVHELTHLYTHYHWGAPRNGRWISEGIAALASGDCQGHTTPALVKGLHEENRLHSWNDLVRQFESVDEIAANLQAASMVEFILERTGLRTIRNLWMSEGWAEAERTLGKDVAEIELEWLQSIRTHPSSARLDVRALRANGCVSPDAN